MAIEAVALVLGEHRNSQVARVDQVREREVDEPVGGAEGHGGLGPVAREGPQTATFAAREHDSENVGTIAHDAFLLTMPGPTPGVEAGRKPAFSPDPGSRTDRRRATLSRTRAVGLESGENPG